MRVYAGDDVSAANIVDRMVEKKEVWQAASEYMETVMKKKEEEEERRRQNLPVGEK